MSGRHALRCLALVALPALVALVGACRESPPATPEPKKLETTEVKAAPDATLSTEGDVVERRRTTTFSGVLPGGFPKDLPVYEPSSLVDFGRGADGAFVVFQTPDEIARVRARYPAALAAQGWSREAGDGFSRGGRRVRVAFEALHPGTRVRVTY